MTEITRRLACLAGAVMLAAIMGCASTAKQEGTGEYVDDSVITAKVKTAILSDSRLKVLQ